MDSHFDHKRAEPRIRQDWDKQNAFKPQGDGEAFCILIPPPNITGVLHMGHALNNTLQDILCRLARMRGHKVLWQPGIDHAGIATQMVVERQLAEQNQPDRHALGREGFIEQIWQWKAQSGGAIIEQLQRLGASCDWSRTRFTLDEGFSKAVREVFVRLYEDGLLYRDRRLVNWDPQLQTTISDLEVESLETKGQFWHFKYPLQDGQTYDFPVDFDADGHATQWETRDYIAIATTRPETMLGDAAIAVHPDDTRYQSIVGKSLILPIADRPIPLIADPYPDPEFGSGAVKITGAHDFNDFQVARRHDLPLYDIMDDQARMCGPIPERYLGLDRFEARAKIVAEMETLGLLIQTEDKLIQQPHGDRSGAVIEPRLKEQWFVDAKKLAIPAIEAVETGKTRFVPEKWTKTYFDWMRNIEPWCVSRQLWWGHRIPAWYDAQGHVYVARTQAEAAAQAQAQSGPGGELTLTQDEDVLDTWFSSALWPFATLGWPDTDDEALKTFYPSNILITGFDIIFFWVARMMMQGLYIMKETPFPEVHMHALVRDASGQKMSKSKGNVVDPIEVMDTYGADALRFTLAAMAVQGRDIRLSEQRIAGYRNFATKLWNAARFCQMRGASTNTGDYTPNNCTQARNRWIVSQSWRTAKNLVDSLESGRFNDAATAIYRFIWNVFCDWYVEMVKPVLAEDYTGSDAQETRAVLSWVLDQCLLMLHPFMPYITEDIWSALGGEGLLMQRKWPDFSDQDFDIKAENEMDWVISLIGQIRSVRSDLGLAAAAKPVAGLITQSKQGLSRLQTHSGTIMRLARLESMQAVDSKPENWVHVPFGEETIVLDISGLIDIGAETQRLAGEIAKIDKEIKQIEQKLANAEFCNNAPEAIVTQTKDRRQASLSIRDRMQAALASLTR